MRSNSARNNQILTSECWIEDLFCFLFQVVYEDMDYWLNEMSSGVECPSIWGRSRWIIRSRVGDHIFDQSWFLVSDLIKASSKLQNWPEKRGVCVLKGSSKTSVHLCSLFNSISLHSSFPLLFSKFYPFLLFLATNLYMCFVDRCSFFNLISWNSTFRWGAREEIYPFLYFLIYWRLEGR